eukprot:2514800-Prymnesium_polylepis.1
MTSEALISAGRFGFSDRKNIEIGLPPTRNGHDRVGRAPRPAFSRAGPCSQGMCFFVNTWTNAPSANRVGTQPISCRPATSPAERASAVARSSG